MWTLESSTHFIRDLFLKLVISVVFFGSPAFVSASEVEVLSYSELMQLSYENRVAYVSGVREILVELSKKKNGRISDSSPGESSKLRSWLEGLDRQFPEVKAQEPEASTSIFCNQDKACGEALASCFEINQTVIWSAGTKSYICDSKKIYPRNLGTGLSMERRARLFAEYQRSFKNPKTFKASSVAEKSQLNRDLFDVKPLFGQPRATRPVQFGLGQAPLGSLATSTISGYVNAMAADNPRKYGCISKHQTLGTSSEVTEACSEAVEAKIARDFKVVLEKSDMVNLSLADRTPRDQPIELKPLAAPVEIPPVAETTIENISETTAQGIPPSLSETAHQRSHSESENAPAKSRELSEAEIQTLLDRAMTAEAPRDQAAAAGAPQSAPKSRSKPASISIPKSKHACAPVPENCGDTKSVRSKIFQGELSCIFGGMVSRFDSQNRKCQAVTEFKLDSTTYRCASGQTMCNPLLFGTVSASKAICIGRGHDATAQCSKLSAPRDAERFLNRNETGLQNKWDDFRTQFANVCKPDTVQAKFHCAECNIMRARLFELHARILSNPCGSRTAGEGAVDGRIRIRSGPTTR